MPAIDRVMTDDGLSIRRGQWRLPEGASAMVAIMNGRTEFIEKYAESAAELNTRGFDVVTWDWRGQGLSDGRSPVNPFMGYVRDFSAYLADLRAALDLDLRGKPLLVLGHSMGGHIALRAAGDGLIHPAAMILSAPMVGLRRPHGIPRSVVGSLANLMVAIGRGESYPPGQMDPTIHSAVFAGNTLTNDPQRFYVQKDWFDRVPELSLGGASWAWLSAACRSCRRLRDRRFVERITMPVTIVQAGQEALVDNPAQNRLTKRLPQGRLVRIDEAKHEILMERSDLRCQFWAAFDEAVGATLTDSTQSAPVADAASLGRRNEESP